MSSTSDPDHLFEVDETGAVHLVGKLDREATATHTVLVWAVDDGVPPRKAIATLAVSTTTSEVYLITKEKHKPRFNQSYF